MTKIATTKRALLASVLSLLLCVSMLIGSTFAWFTSNTSTAVNTIQAGKLKVVLEMKDENGEWVNAEGKVLEFSKHEWADEGEALLWEPGCTYKLPELRIRNDGNLALKYTVEISGIKGDMKLADVLYYTTVDGEKLNITETNLTKLLQDSTAGTENFIYGTLTPNGEANFNWAFHMDENANNDYQGLSLEGMIITVRATQKDSEYDSFDKFYDKNAEYDMSVAFAASTETIQELVNKSAETGEKMTITLTNDIVLDKVINFPAGADVTLDMAGKKMTAKDGTVDPFMEMRAGSSLVITGNGTVDLENNYFSNFIVPRGNVTIENGTFLKNDCSNIASDSIGPMFCGINGGMGVLTIKGGYFDGGYYKEGDCFENCRKNLNLSWGQKVEVLGGTFVAQNPAWGDEGMAFLCDQCQHTTGYCQGTFLVGQDWQDTTMPAGYTIIEGKTEDGRPTYTVNYSK